jgi:hypothetical protein
VSRHPCAREGKGEERKEREGSSQEKRRGHVWLIVVVKVESVRRMGPPPPSQAQLDRTVPESTFRVERRKHERRM